MHSTNKITNYSGRELEAMSFAVKYHKWIIEEFAPYLGDNVAEVGAGIGNISRLLLCCPIKQLYAFEPASNLFPHLQEQLRSEKRAIPINDFFTHKNREESLDSIVYINVLEHIEKDHVELTNARTALRSGGHLMLFVPALEWLYSNLDKSVGHYRRYNKKQLRLLVKDAGFQILELQYFDFIGIIPWYLNFVLLKRSLNSQAVSYYDNYVVPLMRLIETNVTPPIGKNLLLVAKKSNQSFE